LGFEILDVGLVQLSWTGDKKDAPCPKILFGVMIIQPWPHGITLADINRFAVALFARPHQEIHADLLKFGPATHLRVKRAGKYDGLSDPVGTFDKAQAVRVSIGDKDMERERRLVAHKVLNITHRVCDQV